jgi:hypothetical protein
LTALTAVGACSSSPSPQTVACNIRVTDHLDQPIRNAKIIIDDARIGITDEQGLFSTALCGPEERRVRVRVECPANWMASDSPFVDLYVRFLRPITQSSNEFVPLEALFKCQPRSRPQVLVIRTDNRSGIPIMVLGRKVASTDGQGVAQVLLDEEPGSEIEVVLDTSEHPYLRPSMPSRRFAVPAISQILIFDQKFEDRSRRKSRFGLGRHAGPQRL